MAADHYRVFLDQDDNQLEIRQAMPGVLIIEATDENEIAVGILADRALATEVRDALTHWIGDAS